MTDATAEKHGRSLALVQRLLKARGVRAKPVHTVVLRLSRDGRPLPIAERRRRVPELVAYDGGGRMAASVTVGRRSGCYLVHPSSAGAEIRTVKPDRPHAVVDVVLAAIEEGGQGRRQCR
ncbi:hypothetical protein GCM10022252_50990 [Streptosporangium oxazolinicum]|uniref:Uncharacterized protein n=1 Tax=Streptosporangium oxazolinicum TaxID=909287 RepID=A0ABP8B776_9ACTN